MSALKDSGRDEECRLTRRLCRLFRIQRKGGFSGWPMPLVQRLVERRGALVADLVRIGGDARPRPVALRQAMRELADEVGACRAVADERLRFLRAELRIARSEGMPTGIRGGGTGRIIGRG